MAKQIEQQETGSDGIVSTDQNAALAESQTDETTREDGLEEGGDNNGGEQEQEHVLEFDAIKRDEDGNLTWQPNPEKAPHIIYKGKDPNELFSNIAKNIVDKEEYIGQLKSQVKTPGIKVVTVNARTGAPQATKESPSADSVDIVWPDHNEILKNMAQKAGVDMRLFSMTAEQWREHELEHGAVNTMELRSAIRDLVKDAQAEYDSQNAVAVNNHQLMEETDQVAALLQEAEIPFSEFNFDSVLQKVHENQANFLKNGIRRSGAVIAAASREINRLVKEKAKATATAEADDAAARARLNRDTRSGDSTASRATFTRPATKAPATTAEALNQALRAYAQQRKK